MHCAAERRLGLGVDLGGKRRGDGAGGGNDRLSRAERERQHTDVARGRGGARRGGLGGRDHALRSGVMRHQRRQEAQKYSDLHFGRLCHRIRLVAAVQER